MRQFLFPTGTRPAVGRQVTFPQGNPPTGPPSDEALLTALISLGDLSQAGRRCELIASTIASGRTRNYHLSGDAWVTDRADESPLTTAALRQRAEAPVTFLCATIGSGERLGGNRDEDSRLNGDDCAPADPAAWSLPGEVTSLTVGGPNPTHLGWDDQGPQTGPGVRYDVATGDLLALRSSGFGSAACLAGGLAAPSFDDPTPDPAPGKGHFYLTRAGNSCGSGRFGPDAPGLDSLECP